jgi:hypothetical protein
MASHIPVGLSVPPRDLTSATGARTTRFDRPHQCRSSRAPFSIAHEFDLALRPHAHTTSSRPPHPAPRFVTIGRNAPLNEAGCERGTIHQFLKKRKQNFYARGLDRNSRTPPVGQITRLRRARRWRAAAAFRVLYPAPRAKRVAGGWREAPGGRPCIQAPHRHIDRRALDVPRHSEPMRGQIRVREWQLQSSFFSAPTAAFRAMIASGPPPSGP